ncbi:MAG: DDE-type integrase/transposase/recombinase [Thermoproteota archaeon]
MFIGAFEWLLEAVVKAGLFRRNKVSVGHKVSACIMYMAGLSYRAMTVVSGLVPASHVAVYYWVQKLKGLISSCEPRVRRAVAVDETKLKVDGEHLYVWAAIDVDSREVLAVDASWHRSTMNAEHVLKKAMKSLAAEWKHITWGLRNCVERWFRTLKERTKQFHNNFPSRKRGIKCAKLFLETFTYCTTTQEHTKHSENHHQKPYLNSILNTS